MLSNKSSDSRSYLLLVISSFRPWEGCIINERPGVVGYVPPQDLRDDVLIADYRIRPSLQQKGHPYKSELARKHRDAPRRHVHRDLIVFKLDEYKRPNNRYSTVWISLGLLRANDR